MYPHHHFCFEHLGLLLRYSLFCSQDPTRSLLGPCACSLIRYALILQIVLALTDVGLTEADVEFIKYFINIFMYYTADVMKVIPITKFSTWQLLYLIVLASWFKRLIWFHYAIHYWLFWYEIQESIMQEKKVSGINLALIFFRKCWYTTCTGCWTGSGR